MDKNKLNRADISLRVIVTLTSIIVQKNLLHWGQCITKRAIGFDALLYSVFGNTLSIT